MPLAVGWRAEISRKILHLSTALIPAAYLVLPHWAMLSALITLVAAAVLIELLRHGNSQFRLLFRNSVGFMVRSAEWGRISGATYVLLGALLSVWLFEPRVAIAVLLILSISDTAASLIGLRFGRTRFLGKSLAGSSAFFVTALAILWLTLPAPKSVVLVGALVATLAEALPSPRLERFELNDNLTIPLLTGLVLTVLDGWA